MHQPKFRAIQHITYVISKMDKRRQALSVVQSISVRLLLSGPARSDQKICKNTARKDTTLARKG